nr:hypothetical protein Iba_chr11aCG12730 [Ipomoea batatas]
MEMCCVWSEYGSQGLPLPHLCLSSLALSSTAREVLTASTMDFNVAIPIFGTFALFPYLPVGLHGEPGGGDASPTTADGMRWLRQGALPRDELTAVKQQSSNSGNAPFGLRRSSGQRATSASGDERMVVNGGRNDVAATEMATVAGDGSAMAWLRSSVPGKTAAGGVPFFSPDVPPCGSHGARAAATSTIFSDEAFRPSRAFSPLLFIVPGEMEMCCVWSENGSQGLPLPHLCLSSLALSSTAREVLTASTMDFNVAIPIFGTFALFPYLPVGLHGEPGGGDASPTTADGMRWLRQGALPRDELTAVKQQSSKLRQCPLRPSTQQRSASGDERVFHDGSWVRSDLRRRNGLNDGRGRNDVAATEMATVAGDGSAMAWLRSSVSGKNSSGGSTLFLPDVHHAAAMELRRQRRVQYSATKLPPFSRLLPSPLYCSGGGWQRTSNRGLPSVS